MRLPFVVYVLAVGTFLMLTTEFVVAGLLPEIAGDLQVSVAQAGLLITVFAVGMIVGAPTMALLTRRMPRRMTLVLALAVFAAGHVVVALGSSFPLLLAARFVTALATGAFWSVASVVATRAAGPAASARALGLVGAGGHARQRRRGAARARSPASCRAGGDRSGRWPSWRWPPCRSSPGTSRTTTATSSRCPLRSELAALRSGRLWLVLAACATTTGGVLSAYSYISPLLTDRAGIAPGLVPLVLVGFGVGSLIGTISAAASATSARTRRPSWWRRRPRSCCWRSACCRRTPCPRSLLVALLGLLGLSANPVLSALAVRFAGVAPTLGVAMSVAAYNLGTAVGSWIAGLTLGSALGATGPAVVGTVIAALTLIPTIAIAIAQRRRAARATAGHRPCIDP